MSRLLSNAWTVIRNTTVAAAVTGLVAVVSIALIELQGLGEGDRIFLGVLLILGFVLNVVALVVVMIAAFRSPHDGLMDDRLQHFMLSTIGSAAIGVIGMNNIVTFLPPGAALLLLVLAVLLYASTPVLFLYAVWHRIEP